MSKKKRKKLRKIRILIFLLLVLLSGFYFLIKLDIFNDEVTKYTITLNHPKKVINEVDINITGVGDVLIHSQIYKKAYSNGEYDFNPFFINVKDIFEYSELSIANVESLPAGTECGPISSYPRFNTPKSILQALINSNFNAFTFANNHILDKGEKCYNMVLNDMKNYENTIQVGLNTSYEDQRRIRYFEQDGLKVAVLAYTTLTNGIKPPAGKDYLVNYSVYEGNVYKETDGYLLEEDLKADIKTAKENADLVVVMYHHGSYGENTDRIHHYEEEHTEWFLEQGVDIFFGGGAHVIQPVDLLTSSTGHTMYVTYSLGNFIAAQSTLGFQYKIGLIAGIEAKKTTYMDGTEVTELYNPYVIPTIIDSNYKVEAWGTDFDKSGSTYKKWVEEVVNRNTNKFTIYTKDQYLSYFKSKKE